MGVVFYSSPLVAMSTNNRNILCVNRRDGEKVNVFELLKEILILLKAIRIMEKQETFHTIDAAVDTAIESIDSIDFPDQPSSTTEEFIEYTNLIQALQAADYDSESVPILKK
ncbi:hypothetical protein [Alkalinema sp. FACHB-956]|uniref:hypothetical protein n=1 Tax=Alkalinema sp. FACHB-956 TaxID=2692768 RepID=UPI0016825536|nr:hypothetical protein [Alkalinema sp. FACHB-956]MBD2325420.1 hypothetical protein [Alkalinema sp. FACHB-956]